MYHPGKFIGPEHIANCHDHHSFRELLGIPGLQVDLSDAALVYKYIAVGSEHQTEFGTQVGRFFGTDGAGQKIASRIVNAAGLGGRPFLVAGIGHLKGQIILSAAQDGGQEQQKRAGQNM